MALVGAVPHVPAGGTWEVQEEAVGPEGTPVAVVQQANVVLCHLDDPVHIASHNTPVVPAVAGAVAVLRFPLYLLYEYIFTVIDASFWCCHLLLLYVYKKRVATLLVKHIIIEGFWLVPWLLRVRVRFLHDVKGNNDAVGALIHYAPAWSSCGTNGA